jgi:hypothetical protein
MFSFQTEQGMTINEWFAAFGIRPGARFDVVALEALHKRHGFEAILYFEPDLVKDAGYAENLLEYATVPVYERPFIGISEFLAFGAENDPTFEARLAEFPLMVEVADVGERSPESGRPFIRCIMPFLDEIDFDHDPVEGQQPYRAT